MARRPIRWAEYRQALAANQEPVNTPPPALDAALDVPEGAADDDRQWRRQSMVEPLEDLGSGTGTERAAPVAAWQRLRHVGTANLWYNPCGGVWFGSFGALGMTRNAPNPFWTTYNSEQRSTRY